MPQDSDDAEENKWQRVRKISKEEAMNVAEDLKTSAKLEDLERKMKESEERAAASTAQVQASVEKAITEGRKETREQLAATTALLASATQPPRKEERVDCANPACLTGGKRTQLVIPAGSTLKAGDTVTCSKCKRDLVLRD